MKPWYGEFCEVNLPFWRYAYASPFISEIISEYQKISDTKIHFASLCEEGKVSLQQLFRCILLCIKARVKNNEGQKK